MTPASPRAEAATRGRDERPVEATQECGHRLPDALLEDDQAAAHLVEGRRPVFAHFVGIPGGLDLAAKRRVHLVTFRKCQVRPVVGREQRRDAVVFVNHRAAGHFGRM